MLSLAIQLATYDGYNVIVSYYAPNEQKTIETRNLAALFS